LVEYSIGLPASLQEFGPKPNQKLDAQEELWGSGSWPSPGTGPVGIGCGAKRQIFRWGIPIFREASRR